LSPAALDAQAKQQGKAFAMTSACYPTPCGRGDSQVQNYKAAPATRYAVEGRFGLTEAMRHSVNTWFAWRLEASDRTVAAGHADAQPLGQAALRQERPLLALVDELGMNQTLRLDAGLLPAAHRWVGGDVLLASPTTFDPIIDVHGIRQQALGLRMQTTPLQMARLAAAVATGQVAPAHLLLQLNGVNAAPTAPRALSMRVDRVQHAMQEVVRDGTAAGAFAAAEFKEIRPLIHGKTGSAPLAGNRDGPDCARWPASQPAPLACLNNAWFIGYLLPGALPGETRTLAFAVQISRSRLTGGAHAAQVMAQWLAAQRAQQPRPIVALRAGGATPAVGF
jgi:cell division protein FtsI/penicillin-binding protein 2